jgi:tight adherence protein B
VKRLSLCAVVALAVCVFVGTAGAAGPSDLKVLQVNGPAFPVKTYVLTLPESQPLTIHDVQVTEDGSNVLAPTLVPAAKASKETFGVVLLLDTSYSMNGKPLASAIAAEQAFASHRNPNEQLGAIDFNRTATAVLPLTTSTDTINSKLSETPQITTGTHIYDAVAQAEKMLGDAGISSGSIVVLSDGADTGSTNTLKHVGHIARANNIRIYTVGLDDATYKPGTLKALADAGNGQYAQAKAKDLAPLFDQLSRQLSSEYLLQYKSLASLGTHVRVKIQVKGVGTERTTYSTPPASPSAGPTPPYKPSLGSRILDSSITAILLALVVAAVIALLVIAILQPKRSGLPGRMAEFISIPGLQRDKGAAAAAAAGEAEGPGAVKGSNWWTRFEETLEIANIKAAPETIIAGTFAATALTFLLIYAGTGSFWWALFALAIPYISREWIVRTLRARRNKFAEQLPDALQVVASALRSGHSFAGALAVVVESASEPMKSEMQRVVADEQLGIPMQQSLMVVADRMASSDVEQLALVAELQREAGGNAAEVIDRVAETVRERFDLRRLIQTLTMQGRMSRWIVTALPIGIILILQLENPHYLHPLLSSTAGKVVFGLAAAWAVAGSFVIKRIVEIEV